MKNHTEILAHLQKDPLLEKVIQQTSIIPLNPSQDLYADLIKSIIYQQLSGKAANTIHQRFLNLFDNQYPKAEIILQLATEDLRKAGLSQQKASYIKSVAEFAQNNDVSLAHLAKMDDEAIIKYLTQIKGVGSWTVEMLLMFSLNRLDVFSLNDLVIKQSMIKLYQLDKEDKALKSKLIAIANNWKPYRTIACLYLWAWKDSNI